MQPRSKNDQKGGAKDDAARDHSAYAEDEGSGAEPRPREQGDHQDPGKRLTGQGNASKGPWKEQGGAGHGENYGARDKEPGSRSGGSGRGED
jgi:hypothetical protein